MTDQRIWRLTHHHKIQEREPRGKTVLLDFLPLKLSTWALLPPKVSGFVSKYVSWDSHFRVLDKRVLAGGGVPPSSDLTTQVYTDLSLDTSPNSMMLISASNSRVEGFASTSGIHIREAFLISLWPSNSVGCEVENTAFRELTASERKNSKERSGLKIQGIRHSPAGFREGHYRAHSWVGTWIFRAQKLNF